MIPNTVTFTIALCRVDELSILCPSEEMREIGQIGCDAVRSIAARGWASTCFFEQAPVFETGKGAQGAALVRAWWSGLIDRRRSVRIYRFPRDEQLKAGPVGGDREAGLVFILLLGDGDGSVCSGLNIDGQDVAEEGEGDRFVLKVEAFQ